MNIISDRDMYRDKPCNVFVTYLLALRQLTSFLYQFFCLANQALTYFVKINEEVSTLPLLLFE